MSSDRPFTSLHFTHTAFLLLEADRFLASLPRLSRLTVLSQLDAFDENYIVVYHLGVCVCVFACRRASVSVGAEYDRRMCSLELRRRIYFMLAGVIV